jgi:broad specificity phosphatase PhoE
MKHLYLIRHGQNPYGIHDQYCGTSNPFLTPEGIEELHRLKAQGGYPDIRHLHVYTSGWTRAEQTLRELYGEVPHDIDLEFRECNYGDLEGVSRIGLYDKPGFRPWWGSPEDDIPYPNGESWHHVFQRVEAELKRLLKKDEDVLIVCHAGPVAALMYSLFPQDRASVEKWLLLNGHGYGIDFENGRAVRWYDLPIRHPDAQANKKTA